MTSHTVTCAFSLLYILQNRDLREPSMTSHTVTCAFSLLYIVQNREHAESPFLRNIYPLRSLWVI